MGTVFWVLSIAVLPLWAAWIVAPGSRAARILAEHPAGPLGLAAAFAALLLIWLAGAAAGPAPSFDFDGIHAALTTPVGFVVGWAHSLAVDVFVGAWIVRESRRLGPRRASSWRAPCSWVQSEWVSSWSGERRG
jgi:hypothetical protein